MERRVLPGLEADVSAMGAGCWTIGGPATNRGVPIGWDDVDSHLAYTGLVRAYELGVTLYDTADVYGLGQSERLLGRLLREVPRQELVISSKVGYFAGTARHPYDPEQMGRQFSTTLDNLGTDYLDIYFLHSDDFGDDNQYLPDAVKVMRELREHGLVRAIGMRAPHTFAEQWATRDRTEARTTARWLSLFDQIQPEVITARYNLLSPLYADDETDIFTFARRHGAGVLIKQALGQGLFLRSGPRLLATFSSSDHRHADPMFTAENRQRVHARLAPLRDRYGDDPADLARVALRYVLQHAPDAAVLVGFRSPDQIHATLTCLGDPLHEEEIIEIRTLLHPSTT